MKVIDLLNKIANDEIIPGKIKYNEKIYHYGNHYKWYLTDNLLEELFIDKNHLNDEIEIIEDTPKEDKKIKKLKVYDDMINWCCNGSPISDIEKDIIDKINEIIDRLNGEDNE